MNAKNVIKPYVNAILNLFFRDNNLLIALFLSLLRGNHIIIRKNVILRHCKVVMRGSENELLINENACIGGMDILIQGIGNNVSIGRNTKVNANSKQPTLLRCVGGGKISIGDECLLSNNIEIHNSDYHKILKENTIVNPSENIFIGNHTWIGLQCLILKGTCIPNDCIVGARSLVTKKFVEPNTLIAGSPAKIIKRDVEWFK